VPPLPGANAMTAGADQIALRNFSEDDFL